MSIQKLINLLEKSKDKTAKAFIEVTALKYLEIMSVQYYLNGEILISTKDKI